MRQLTDSATGSGPHTVSTFLAYSWELDAPLGQESVELWSSDYPTLSAFCEAVESHESFGALAALPATDASVQVEDSGTERP